MTNPDLFQTIKAGHPCSEGSNMSNETERPEVAERCPACGGFRTLRTSAGYDKAVCRGTPECLAQLLEEAKTISDRRAGRRQDARR